MQIKINRENKRVVISMEHIKFVGIFVNLYVNGQRIITKAVHSRQEANEIMYELERIVNGILDTKAEKQK